MQTDRCIPAAAAPALWLFALFGNPCECRCCSPCIGGCLPYLATHANAGAAAAAWEIVFSRPPSRSPVRRPSLIFSNLLSPSPLFAGTQRPLKQARAAREFHFVDAATRMQLTAMGEAAQFDLEKCSLYESARFLKKCSLSEKWPLSEK